jgi:cytoskeleton protein RodZ
MFYSWHLLAKSGNELANATKQAGESLTVQGESPFAIELNPADAVQFSFNNKPIDLKPYTVNGVVNFRLSR